MALRRIVSRLREHDWTAVVIEVLIVVAGVIIALQVSNWNDERKDAQRGQEYLQRLQAELNVDIAMLDPMITFRREVQKSGMAAMAHAESDRLHQGSAWKTVLAYYQASQIWPYRKPDVTFQEIRSSGDLALIRDTGLRAHIATHYSSYSGSGVAEVLQLIPPYRERVRGLTPWAVQAYIWEHCYRTTMEVQVMIDCKPPISESESLAVLAGYRKAPDLLSGLRFWMATNRLGIDMLVRVKADAQQLVAEIGKARDR